THNSCTKDFLMTTHQPFFSVITASLNNAATLTDALNSIRAQGFRDLEHIVIDGGSQDDTLRILESYKDTYNLRWISEPDEGISDALNKGVRLSAGKYLLVIQADDFLISDDVLTHAYNLLSDEQFDIMSFPVYVVYQNGTKVLYEPRKYTNIRYHFKNIFPHQGTFVHKRVYDAVGLFRTELHISMDYDFFYRCMNAKRSFCKGNIPIAVWRAEGISHTQKYTRILYEMRVQDLNEDSKLWRVAQRAFRLLYVPYRKLHSIVNRLRSRYYGMPIN
ncbi:MAG: glycosyltransferase, partial [Gammaproteobacteria bacterium]|nr:glycosyltransferase [Gammaproteobacteria bacterium]